ncbi:ABC transporter permease [Neotabrizicola shimadae]|uniref:ABC transporter permease n=1 Tax=Neotabrizicola shimadae TaxID=2807096 RepID=A0A8G1ED64_9RHOB|nr:ABC transporter permease [Neotabrizicola shimadae]QYZ69838.1 ABC transporter permease [Neotabrizicola shimadae]
MFRVERKQTGIGSAFALLELIFHASVRHVRKSHGNAVIGLLLAIFQSVLMIAVFYFMLDFLGMRQNKVRGDFLLFIMSGVFLFMTHSKAMGAVVRSDGPTSAMMKHGPMNPLVAICAAALGSLYLQVLSAAVILFVYDVAFQPISIHEPVGAMAMFLLAWASGAAIGMVFKAAMPWQPDLFGVVSQVYNRANIIGSGKMFLANNLPSHLLPFFIWNPLFHTIDQARGFIFLNYSPRVTSISYPVYVTLACIVVGLMGEFYTRRHASISWNAGR